MKLLLLLSIFVLVWAENEISDTCLGCICQASSGCNKDEGCSEAGVCGPFLITWGFWADAGKLVIKGTNPDDKDAYSQCSKDMFCAAETVRSYMRKWAKDCNGDGQVTCEDYARVHRMGPNACHDSTVEKTKYFEDFSKCNKDVKPQ